LDCRIRSGDNDMENLLAARSAPEVCRSRSPDGAKRNPGAAFKPIDRSLDYAEPVIGPTTSGRTRWLHPGYNERKKGGRTRRHAARIIAETFSAIMITGRLVFARVTHGMMEASATRRPSTPMTRHRSSATPIGSRAPPIRHVPDG